MASLGDVKRVLREVYEDNRHYRVGEESEKCEDTVRSWIVAVHEWPDGEIILQLSDQEEFQETEAISVERLYQSISSLSQPDSTLVELSFSGPEEEWSLHIPIVGAHLLEDKEVLVFRAWDRDEEEG